MNNILGDPQYYWGWIDLSASMAFPPFRDARPPVARCTVPPWWAVSSVASVSSGYGNAKTNI